MMGLWVFGIAILVVTAKSVNGITCAEAEAALWPCQVFLVGTATAPSPPCCSAVDTLNKQATTKEIRQQLCQCFKDAAPSFGVKPEKAKQLPALCHISVPVPIDPSVDCSKIG